MGLTWNFDRLAASLSGGRTARGWRPTPGGSNAQRLSTLDVCQNEVWLSDSGVFRFDVHRVGDESFCQLRVYKGAAATRMQTFDWVLTTGKMIDLNRICGDHIQRGHFNIEVLDELDHWNRSREVSDAHRRQ